MSEVRPGTAEDRIGPEDSPGPMTHIAVCVCTYKRPEMLGRLLASLREQVTEGLFRLSVTVVDNDKDGSAGSAAAAPGTAGPLPVRYLIEPVQNISLARNRALTGADADYYACLDDDEFADRDWALNLYRTIVRTGAAGVLGPVRPHFDPPAPAWLVKGRILERREFPTDTPLTDPKYCRTGNVLFSRELLAAQELLFDPSYGRTGGEDVDFFRRMIGRGHRFVWCNDAVVHEAIPPERRTRVYYLRRALLRGVVQAGRAPLLSFDTLKSVAAGAAYTLALPFVFVLRHRSFLPLLIRDLDHAGKVLARLGIRPVKGRRDA